MKKSMWRNVVAVSIAVAVIGTAGAATTATLAVGFTTPKTQSFDYSADTAIVGKNLSVTTRFARVSVSTSSDSELHVRAEGSYRGDTPTVGISDDGSKIEVECSYRKRGSCDIGLELRVPAGLMLDIDGAAADVVLTDVDAQTSVSTSAGSVTARGSAGTLDVTTRFGDVDITDAAVSALDVDTTFGQVALDSRVPPNSVRVQNMQGDSMIELPAAEFYDVEATSEKGDVDIDVVDDPNSPRSVSITSEEGQISVQRR
ncbi:hypothetical protein CH251_00030 [Rhodococcus sp. 06-462-5]|uniref:DUF4097 family beta strand repeat-containing protein n=1 Tax=unclassified Rhodococcus (in: high G+C Gram-positive bacteria) TaxID=192944 RepID=UPI000B9A2FF8|nr:MULTISPECIES: DUF4097 family beta strand repeat-containing protein [unclassified Rhodococcus (in: high G+C Gram-positive bacteria)]OZC79341.1 hypothetical protein CH251_00030 [Rhodococcus sp. 06-462-5]OZE59898.1 hypothetical protein CH270_21970 [Rhodococcus sp. 02-925g]